uniref:ABC transporter domain-containing protein n=1 Tax=Oryza glumipatula TaxID=40148 RepID=A0A0D9ZTJ0_9ORYZ
MAILPGDCVVLDIDDAAAQSTPVPYALTFTDLSYTVGSRRAGLLPPLPTDAPPAKALLDGISGEARDGEVLAVMGASGSGKSTLLDALAGRIARGSLRGRVELNGEALHGRRVRAISAYWIWFHYLSLVKYPYQAVLQNEFRDAARCFSRGVEMFDGTPIGAMSKAVKLKVLDAIGATLGAPLTAETCVVTGADVLAQQAVTDIGRWKCLLVTVAFGFFFRFLFYIVLHFGSKNKRR